MKLLEYRARIRRLRKFLKFIKNRFKMKMTYLTRELDIEIVK